MTEGVGLGSPCGKPRAAVKGAAAVEGNRPDTTAGAVPLDSRLAELHIDKTKISTSWFSRVYNEVAHGKGHSLCEAEDLARGISSSCRALCIDTSR